MADTLITKWTIDTSQADAAARRLAEDVTRVTSTLGKPIAMHVDSSASQKDLARAAADAQKVHDTIVKPSKLKVDTSEAEAGAKSFLDKMKGKLATLGGEGGEGGGGFNLGSLLGGAVGGAALTAGLDAAKEGLHLLKEGFDAVIDAGFESLKINQQLESSFKQAGLSGSGLSHQFEDTSHNAETLSLKFGITADHIKEVSGQAAFLGGATGQMNDDITKLAVGLEKGSEGAISSTEAIRIFTKGLNDPEAVAGIGKLKLKFPELATALKGIKDPAELTQKALTFLGPTFASLEGQAKGPIGAVDNLKNSFHDVLESLGESVLKGGQPIFDIFTKLATFFETKLAPAMSSLEPVIRVVITPFAELFDLLTSGQTAFALILPILPFLAIAALQVGIAFGVIVSVIKIVIGILRPVTQYFSDLLQSIIGAGAGAGSFIDLIKEKFGPVLSDIGNVLTTVGEIIGQVIVLNFKIMIGLTTALVRAVISVVSGLLGIKGGAASASDGMGAMAKVAGFLRDALLVVQSVINGVKGAFVEAGRVIDDVAKVISNVSLTNIGETLDKLLSLLGEAPSRIAKAGSDGFKDTLGRGQALRALEDATNPVIDGFKSQLDKLKDASGKIDFSKAKLIAEQAKKDITAKAIGVGFEVDQPAVTDLLKKINAILEEVAPPTGSKKLEVPVTVKPVDFKEDIEKAMSEVQKIRDQIDIKSAKDAFNRLKAEFKARTDLEIDQNKRALEELEKKKKEAADQNKKIDEASYSEAIKATKLILIEQGRLRAIEEKEAIEKLAVERVKLFTDAETKESDARIKGLQLTERTITGMSLDALKRRGEAHLAVILAQQQKELDLQIEALPDFQEAAKKLELAFFNGTDHSKAAEDRLKRQLQQMLADFKVTNAEAIALAAAFQVDADRLTREAALAAEEFRISLIPDDAERERAKKLFEVQKTLDAELARIGDNEELKTLAIERADRERFRINQDYLQKENTIYGGALAFFKGFSDQKAEQEHAKREGELVAERNKLAAEEIELRLSYARRKVTVEDFDKKLGEISQRRDDLDRQIEENKLTIIKRTQMAAGAAATELQDRFLKSAQKAIDDSAAKIDKVAKAGVKGYQALGDAGGVVANIGQYLSNAGGIAIDSFKELGKVGMNAIGAVASQMAALALATKLNFGQIASYATSTLINIAQNALAANIVTIYSTAIGMLGPVGGILAATAAVATVEGLLAYAEAKLAENRPKFHTGGVDIRSPHGRGTEFDAKLLDGETVFDPQKTKEWGWLFNAIQEGRYRYSRDIVTAPQLQPHLSDHSEKIDRTLTISMDGVESRLDRIAGILSKHSDKLAHLDTLPERGKDHSEKLGWINDRMGELLDIADDDGEPATLRGHDLHVAARAFALRRRWRD